MPELSFEGRRIGVERSLGVFIKSMNRSTGEAHAVFETMADAIAFAAAYGSFLGPPKPVVNRSKDPDPIRISVFNSRGYDSLIDLLALNFKRDVEVLRNSEEAQSERAEIFEGYSNRGLAQLETFLRQHADKAEGIQLLVSSLSPSAMGDGGKIDLSSLVKEE